MGTHASAVVFYGYDLGDMEDHETWESLAPEWYRPNVDEDDEDGETEAEDPEDRLARLLGWVEAPFPAGCPNRSAYGLRGDANDRFKAAEEAWRATPEYEAWIASLNEKRRVIAEDGPAVEFAWYGYLGNGDTGHYLAVRESEQRIPEYGSAPLDVTMMDGIVSSSETSGDWNDRLARYVELMELGPALRGATPGWHVAVKYG